MSILIKNGNVYNVHTGEFKKSDILIKDTKIKTIRENITIDVDHIINAEGKNIFPGFIDAHSHIGMWPDVKNGNDANECVNPVTPNMRAIDGLNPMDKDLVEVMEEGFTTIMITPGSGNVICGQAAIIKTGGKTYKDMIVNPYAAFKMALGENPKNVYGSINKSPSSRMSTAFILEENLIKGREYYNKRVNGLVEKNIELEPYMDVFSGKVPLKIHCHRADDICTAIRIAESFSLDYTLDHCTEGYLIKEHLKEINKPLLMGPLYMFRSKQEVRNRDLCGIISLVEEGCEVSFISDHPVINCGYMLKFLGLSLKKGLSYKDAIKMVTINPAKALKIDNITGSLEEGKDADIVIYDGDPLEGYTKNLVTIINGEIKYNKLSEKQVIV